MGFEGRRWPCKTDVAVFSIGVTSFRLFGDESMTLQATKAHVPGSDECQANVVRLLPLIKSFWGEG